MPIRIPSVPSRLQSVQAARNASRWPPACGRVRRRHCRRFATPLAVLNCQRTTCWALGVRSGHHACVVVAAFQRGWFLTGPPSHGKAAATTAPHAGHHALHGRGRQSARAAVQRWEPDKRQRFSRHRRPLPYSTCENANGYEKSGSRHPRGCSVPTAPFPPPTAHCALPSVSLSSQRLPIPFPPRKDSEKTVA